MSACVRDVFACLCESCVCQSAFASRQLSLCVSLPATTAGLVFHCVCGSVRLLRLLKSCFFPLMWLLWYVWYFTKPQILLSSTAGGRCERERVKETCWLTHSHTHSYTVKIFANLNTVNGVILWSNIAKTTGYDL